MLVAVISLGAIGALFGTILGIAGNHDRDYFIETARILIELTAELALKLGIAFEFINLGGGVDIPPSLGSHPP